MLIGIDVKTIWKPIKCQDDKSRVMKSSCQVCMMKIWEVRKRQTAKDDATFGRISAKTPYGK
jgi:hypothetical protein